MSENWKSLLTYEENFRIIVDKFEKKGYKTEEAEILAETEMDENDEY
tara:strand:- start:737 stop:877 length:141 start_codon:yes stop_codon:yes gene_type:complete